MGYASRGIHRFAWFNLASQSSLPGRTIKPAMIPAQSNDGSPTPPSWRDQCSRLKSDAFRPAGTPSFARYPKAKTVATAVEIARSYCQIRCGLHP
jgi:hypothetical protein